MGAGDAALADLDPLVAVLDVDLQTLGRVRMDTRLDAVLRTRERGAHDDLDHLFEITGVEPEIARDPPEVQLVRQPGVEPVDRVSAVDEARAHEQHVFGTVRRERTQRARDQGRRVRAQHLGRRHVSRVARVARDGVGRVAERVVVVVQRDDARTAMDSGHAAPRTGQRGDDVVDDALQRVRTLRRIREVAHGEGAREFDGSEQRNRHGSSLASSRARGVGPPGRRRRMELRLRAHPTAPVKGPGAQKSLRTRRGHATHRSHRVKVRTCVT